MYVLYLNLNLTPYLDFQEITFILIFGLMVFTSNF